jgi:hypothetical protein
MSEMPIPTPSVLLIGGPDAGKSNFLFRFWLGVDSGTGALVKDTFPDELEYLRTGLECLLRGEFAGHTSKEVLEHATIPIKSAHEPLRSGILNVPDVPGEKILQVYHLRRWDALWEERILEGCGCLVFIRAASEEIVRPLDYTECLKLFGSTLNQNAEPSSINSSAENVIDAPNGNPQVVERSASPVSKTEQFQVDALNVNHPAVGTEETAKAPEPPTDVVLTDWMQFLRRAFTDRVSGSYRPKVGIVIAAWDAVPSDAQAQSPFDYLANNFPLLRQFIETNGERFDFQVFGLSILGGDLKNDPEFRAIFIKGKPNDFGYVIHSLNGQLERINDVTVPVAWALGWFPPAHPLEARP